MDLWNVKMTEIGPDVVQRWSLKEFYRGGGGHVWVVNEDMKCFDLSKSGTSGERKSKGNFVTHMQSM